MEKVSTVIRFRRLYRRKYGGEFQEIIHFVMNATEVIGKVARIESLELAAHTVRGSVEIEEFFELCRGIDAMLIANARDALAVFGWNMME